MATQGTFTMAAHGATVRFSWDVARQDIGGNYTVINWRVSAEYPATSWYHIYFLNFWVNGVHVYNKGGGRVYGGQIASGQATIYHEPNGNKWFDVRGEGSLYASGANAWGNGGWELPTIPRHGHITGVMGSFHDEQHQPWIDFSTPAGGTTQVWFELPQLTGRERYCQRDNIRSRYTWTITEQEMDSLRRAMANTSRTPIRYVFANFVGGSWVERVSEHTLTIVNAAPTEVKKVSYQDMDPRAKAITGSASHLIQGISRIRVSIDEADFATAKKGASIVRYIISCGGESFARTVPASGGLTQMFTTLRADTDQAITVRAIDSRGNSSTNSHTVARVIPYTRPTLTLGGKRRNEFENETTFTASGTLAPLMLGTERKNSIQTARWRTREDGGTWGAWQNALAGVRITDNTQVAIPQWLVGLDNTKVFECEFELRDRLTTVKATCVIDAGIPIFRIGLDGKLYNNEQVVMTSHVGQIIQSTTLNTAEKVKAIYGGTWILWGEGRVIVGVGSNGTTNYAAAEQTGGSDRVQLTTAQMPRHVHTYWAYHWREGGGIWVNQNNSPGANYAYTNGTSAEGGDQAHENRQSYITAYQWKRVL